MYFAVIILRCSQTLKPFEGFLKECAPLCPLCVCTRLILGMYPPGNMPTYGREHNVAQYDLQLLRKDASAVRQVPQQEVRHDGRGLRNLLGMVGIVIRC